MAFFNEFPHTRNYDSDLGWLIESVRKLIECCDSMTEWKDNFQEAYEELIEIYNQIISGELPEGIVDALNRWMEVHGIDLIGELVKMVFFGLTDSGYFVAYIPESWEDIIFKTTGWDTAVTGIDYGHLVLSY